MLSDHDRETLREIQAQFAAEDPDLTRSLASMGETPPPAHLRTTYTLAMLACVVFSLFMLGTGSLGGLVIFGSGVAGFALLRQSQH